MNGIATVLINGSTREFDKGYDYLIPEGLQSSVVPGVRVIVPFGGGNNLKEAYVLKLSDHSDFKGLKEIRRVVDDRPVLSEQMMALAAWMKHRYVCTYSDAIKCMLPAGIGVKSHRMVRLIVREEAGLNRQLSQASEPLKKDEQKLLDYLTQCGGECEYNELRRNSKVKSFQQCIKTLEEAGLLQVRDEYSTAVREKTVRVASLAMPPEEVLEDIENNRVNRIQQIRVLEMLLENEYISVADLARFANVSTSVLDTLRKYGYICYREIEVRRDPLKHRSIERTEPMVPTVQQQAALDYLKEKLDARKFSETLIHGVTGSGKTEIYLQLIQHAMDAGKQAIVLVPEISLTPQMVERFKGRFGNEVAVLHSRLSLGERYDQWRLIREGGIKVAVGARSAVFAPFDQLGIILIDEEHENSYKSEITPKYQAADIARKRCMDNGAALIYGSATPSVETFYRARSGEIGLLELTERANRMVMPAVHVVDMRSELESGNRSIFSGKLAEELRANIVSEQQTILFLNRRGYASFILCRSCGIALKCTQCNISLTYHAHDERLICHYCGFTTRMPKTCPRCSSTYIRQFGTGTQKVEEELCKQFPGCSAIRMDMDTTSCKNSHEEILKAFREENINVLVGTQMIAKGHDFPNVTLVGVLAADSLLNLDDYKASERTFQLITQVAGRAGRGELPGRVVIQTYNTEDFSIRAACEHDYAVFYRQEIKIREKLKYPPFTHIGVMILSGFHDRQVFSKAKEVRQWAADSLSGGEDTALVLGPMRAPLSRIKNRYRWRLVIKCGSLEKLIHMMEQVSDRFHQGKKKSEIDLSMDIDPSSML